MGREHVRLGGRDKRMLGIMAAHLLLFNTSYLTPGGCPTIQFNSETKYLELAQMPQVKGLSPISLPLLQIPA